MSAPTPGPWSCELYQDGGFEIKSPVGGISGGMLVIASRGRHANTQAMHANARLLAAAPNLLDALHRICDAESLREARHIAEEALAALGGDE